MNLLHTYLQQPRVRTTLKRSPGEQGFSLIELVVVIAVLAVLTAIALPNFLGVTEDASARTAQQGVLNAYKECKVFWARNKREGFGEANTREFNKPAITGWGVVAQASAQDYNNAITKIRSGQPSTGSTGIACFDNGGGERDFFAVPLSANDRNKFPIYRITSSGERNCRIGLDSTSHPDTYDIGCGDVSGNFGIWE